MRLEFGAALAEGLEESFGAGVGDGAEVLDELVARHADAGVLNRDGLGLVVGGDGDFEFGGAVLDFLFGELRVAQFLEGVGGVGNELADEDFFLRVERVDDDIEQLLDLGLELEFLRSGGGHRRERWTGRDGIATRHGSEEPASLAAGGKNQAAGWGAAAGQLSAAAGRRSTRRRRMRSAATSVAVSR